MKQQVSFDVACICRFRHTYIDFVGVPWSTFQILTLTILTMTHVQSWLVINRAGPILLAYIIILQIQVAELYLLLAHSDQSESFSQEYESFLGKIYQEDLFSESLEMEE